MKKNYGYLTDEPGVYRLDKIPECGNFEYIYKNANVFLKVDQFGPSLIQVEPPAGMTILQRKERETFSPWKYYFSIGKTVYHNFDIYRAKKFLISYYPNRCEYKLDFGSIETTTELFVDSLRSEVIMSLKFVNKGTSIKQVSLLGVASLDPIDPSMAVWDKKEWYSTTDVDEKSNPLFITRHFSVNGNKKERRNIALLFEGEAKSLQKSAEKLKSVTKNYNIIPNSIASDDDKTVCCYEQICGALLKLTLEKEARVSSVVRVYKDDETINKQELIDDLLSSYKEMLFITSNQNYQQLISQRSVQTADSSFNSFVNSFLPLELSWVTDLDRGWPTGMRGSRDCANDFLGYLSYDKNKCRKVIETLFNNERYSDGWFPRQIPFGESNKYDMRPFSDSGCFVIELIYEYLAYTNDDSILTDAFSYLNGENSGTGIEHLIKAASFYCREENIGEHGLIKLHGGDWLDCLNKVGLQGRGETMMVTCQAILAFKQVVEILNKYSPDSISEIETFNEQSKTFVTSVKKQCYIPNEGFYRALFSDDGKWYFSEKDADGYKRVYVPTNAYAIIAGINPSKDNKVIRTINQNNETRIGFKLFTEPFGNPPFEGIGKMGTGDFQPYMFENGAVYNHGANLFYVRALAKAGDYKTLYRALNYALPYNPKFHPENESCLPSYAITNAYNLTPSFYGRSGMCFLTGSIAMIERAIYSWMYGLDYHLDELIISPCLPIQYGNSTVVEHYNGKKLTIRYSGYGNKVIKCIVDKIDVDVIDAKAHIKKSKLNKDVEIEVQISK